MPEYFRGLDKGLSILQGMREYEFSMSKKNEKICKMFLNMVIADYTHQLEDEKAKALSEMPIHKVGD